MKKLLHARAPFAGLLGEHVGPQIAAYRHMKEPSDKRKRTLELQDRAIRFSVAVNSACPEQFTSIPSSVVWGQLVRAADSTSNNLCEADDASSDADFLHKIKLALREANESRVCLAKLRLGALDNHNKAAGMEDEARQLASIFSTIARKVELRLGTKGAKCRKRLAT